jgi:hypothetical protein
LSLVFVVIMFFLSLATLATSFAAATLAKDTKIVDGNLVGINEIMWSERKSLA